MSYTLASAAERAGVRKSTVFRWVKSGRLSASRTDSGTYRIDAAELDRFLSANAVQHVETATPERSETPSEASAPPGAPSDAATAEAIALRSRVAVLETLLEAEKQRAQEWRAQADRLVGIVERLALPAPSSAPTVSATEPRRGLLGRLFG